MSLIVLDDKDISALQQGTMIEVEGTGIGIVSELGEKKILDESKAQEVVKKLVKNFWSLDPPVCEGQYLVCVQEMNEDKPFLDVDYYQEKYGWDLYDGSVIAWCNLPELPGGELK